jgi:hypothetical protein
LALIWDEPVTGDTSGGDSLSSYIYIQLDPVIALFDQPIGYLHRDEILHKAGKGQTCPDFPFIR